jgi:hypothetical protein
MYLCGLHLEEAFEKCFTCSEMRDPQGCAEDESDGGVEWGARHRWLGLGPFFCAVNLFIHLFRHTFNKCEVRIYENVKTFGACLSPVFGTRKFTKVNGWFLVT